MRILFIGDIIGKPGRSILHKSLKRIKADNDIEFIIANGENAAGGFGITPKITLELFSYGVDVVTSGNHIWNRREIIDFISSETRLIRPANYPKNVPGQGSTIITLPSGNQISVLNLCGRVFMKSLECPFRVAREHIEEIKKKTNLIIVDFHAEATSEKVAMGWFLDGIVSAVIGTHTHIPTADERILPRGTAYITDVGMTGPIDSVIGLNKDVILDHFITQLPKRFEIAQGGLYLNGVLIDLDTSTGLSKKIERICVPSLT
ncbi:MAG: TIGR00282 family metallophosphoesterase [Thermodesulfobacteriota bacterium]|nr:TIGR00282 family metallophosphoesterase [Thermodesulfobacteriota bacterium]